ncbi:hypothetical protein OWM54_16305 [Myxococcus sp. MISCRS1]|uniref:MopE-related protein n=1 Tax=Myxococcus sp. MISCRS1 TaxID=2996786 RepID=UPI002270B380|nr:MopE-related protein [Myxococcus sp. MISCRS1]MCY0998702.1 hypothetical protein [Myxococcus sp. MISCRS1]
MKTFESWLRALTAVLLLSGVAGCKVTFPDNAAYTCEKDGDCGGEGFVCTSLPDDGPRYCCRPEGAERCNGLDDDCDGAIDELEATCFSGKDDNRGKGACRDGQSVCTRQGTVACVGDVLPTVERCNGVDDDCDGEVDEDFNRLTDPFNCGTCGTVCTALQTCVEGVCQKRGELDCGNGIDDNRDGATDCADRDDCDGQACGVGCLCENGRQTESDCGNGEDDDEDRSIDCADRDDCEGKSCGAGCVCTDGRKTESLCTPDSGDEDGDGRLNCADPDCERKECGPGLSCNNVGSCVEGACDNGEDDDGDGQTDCADSDCSGQSCGVGCACRNSAKAEASCTDGIDNDGDGTTDTPSVDCQDSDCGGQLCVAGEPNAVCGVTSKRCAEVSCNDLVDNDKDGLTDCADTQDCPNNSRCSRLVDGNRVAGVCRSGVCT